MGRVNRTLSPIVTPTITAGAYGAGDVVGGLLTFTSDDGEGAGGTILALVISDDAATSAVLTLYLFDEAPTAIADNAAYELTHAQNIKRIGTIPIAAADWVPHNGNTYAIIRLTKTSEPIPFSGIKIYGYLVCTATPSFAGTSDLSLKLITWRD